MLLCARRIPQNVRSNYGGPKLLAVVIPKLRAISIPPLIADQSGHLRSVDVCIWTFPALNILLLLLLLRCFTCGSPLFAKKPRDSQCFPSRSQRPSSRALYLSTHPLSLFLESEEERHTFWTPAIGRDAAGQGMNPESEHQ